MRAVLHRSEILVRLGRIPRGALWLDHLEAIQRTSKREDAQGSFALDIDCPLWQLLVSKTKLLAAGVTISRVKERNLR